MDENGEAYLSKWRKKKRRKDPESHEGEGKEWDRMKIIKLAHKNGYS